MILIINYASCCIRICIVSCCIVYHCASYIAWCNINHVVRCNINAVPSVTCFLCLPPDDGKMFSFQCLRLPTKRTEQNLRLVYIHTLLDNRHSWSLLHISEWHQGDRQGIAGLHWGVEGEWALEDCWWDCCSNRKNPIFSGVNSTTLLGWTVHATVWFPSMLYPSLKLLYQG